MKEYDLYVPLIFKNNRLPPPEFAALKKRLVKKFGGLTFFPQKNKGFWKIGPATFQDEVEILRVLSDKNCKSFWHKLKKDLQKQWKQKEILIVIRRVKILD
jgi:hypothetical protein